MKKEVLVLFDFDGTITSKDTLIEIIRFDQGSIRLLLGLFLLLPTIISYKIGMIPNWKAKELMLKYFWKNYSISDFNDMAESFSNKKVPKFIRKKAMEAIKFHQLQNHRIIIVSASAENWLAPWASKQTIEVIATKLEVLDGKITGSINGHNCYGKEKVNRIRAQVNLNDYDKIYAYGDSHGDKEMLKIATDPHYKPFK